MVLNIERRYSIPALGKFWKNAYRIQSGPGLLPSDIWIAILSSSTVSSVLLFNLVCVLIDVLLVDFIYFSSLNFFESGQ